MGWALSQAWIQAYAAAIVVGWQLSDSPEDLAIATRHAVSMSGDWLSLPGEGVSENMKRAAQALRVGESPEEIRAAMLARPPLTPEEKQVIWNMANAIAGTEPEGPPPA